MNILVTGGAGYIGSITAEKLSRLGHKIFVIDDLSKGIERFIPREASFFKLKVHETQEIKKILRNYEIDSIVHFAAHLDVAESMSFPLKYYANNFNGTLALLAAMEDSPVKKMVFSSTAAVYKDSGQVHVHELSPVDPLSPYGNSKLMSERVIAQMAEKFGFKFCVLRYFNVAGASADLERGQLGTNATALFKRAALAAVGKIPEIKIFGTDYPTLDGTGVRDYIHVEDLAELHVESLNYLEGGGRSDIFNCGYGMGFSVKQVLEAVESVSGREISKIMSPRRPGDLAQVVASNKKIKEIFQWNPKFNDLKMIAQSAYLWEQKNET